MVLIITITLSIFSTIPSYGQEKSKEDSNTKEESWYSRFTRRKIEERTLFKLGFKSMGAGQYNGRSAFNVTSETTIEYKFNPLVSFNFKLKNTWGRRIVLEPGALSFFEGKLRPFHNVDVSPEIRFYLGMRKGVEKGERGNNFSGKFIVVQFDEMINIGKTNIKQPKLNLLFGIQQRLGKFGYIDLMVGPSYNIRDNEIALFGEFAIGFAF